MASGYTIIFNALLINMAFFFFGGWAAIVVIYAPYISIPASLILGAIAFGVLQAVGAALKAISSLTLPNLLAACSILGLLLGFVPSRFVDGLGYRNRFDMLFEDYAISLIFYSVLLHIMAIVWWASSHKSRNPAA